MSTWISNTLTFIWQTLRTIAITDLLDIALVSVMLFFAFRFIRERRAGKLALGIGLLFLIMIISDVLEMYVTRFFLQNVFQVGILVLIVLFQPEIRSALEKIGGEPIKSIKGIGEQRAKALAKLDIFTLRDLISYFPRTYDDRRRTRTIATLCNGETVCVEAMVATAPTLQRIRKGMELLKTHVVDASGTLDLVFFNQVYLRDTLRVGETYTFFGKAEGEGRRKSMTNPIVEREGSRSVTGRIVPVYPLTAGVTQNFLVKSMEQGLAACRDLLPDVLPDEVRRALGLCHIGYAYEKIHFPEHEEELSIARRRLVFEE